MSGTVLILGGSGKIGRHSTETFKKAGWNVRQFDRRTENMVRAAQGCDVILNGLNPPNYHNWKEIIPAITADVIEAARSSGATVAIPGNVYHFGERPGIWSEKTIPLPVSRKGRIRLEMERDYQDSGVQTIVLRAGNFIDPERRGCVMSEVYLSKIKQGKVTLPGPSETRQAMCYLPDWARACVDVVEQRRALSHFEDIPFPGHTLSAKDIKTELERITGRPIKFATFPWRILELSRPVWELASEVSEMRYLWNTDHSLSGQKFHDLVPDFKITPLDEVMRSALPK